MILRIVSAAVLVPITLAVVYFAPPFWYLAVLGLVGSFCLFEYYQITRALGADGQPWFGYPAFWVLITGLWGRWLPAPVLCVCLVVAAFLAAMWRRAPMRTRVFGLMANLLGVFYLAFCLFAAYSVRHDRDAQAGLQWTLIALVVIWTGDSAALFCGKSFGRTRFAPELSPKKTNEGAAGGLLAEVLVAILLRHWFFPGLPVVHVIGAALLIGIFGQLGDLAESMLKRAADIKESSNLIPGHGGVLDRIDSLLFAFPALYAYLYFLYG
jgi:phosphatidate cytidylyltransferase